MIPFRIVETDREGFDTPVVELWRDDEFVGMVFWDGETSIAQIYPDDDGDVKDLDIEDLFRALEFANQIVTPEEYRSGDFDELRAAIAGGDEGGEGAYEYSNPGVVALLGEFDERVAYRNEDGEGYFPRPTAKEFVARCDELDLAVVEMEGFDLDLGELTPRPNLTFLARSLEETWESFRPNANRAAAARLAEWPGRETLVVAFVIQLEDGESVVA
jgi:hypothetical protein